MADTETRETESDRMRDLATSVARDLEAEAKFDPDDFALLDSAASYSQRNGISYFGDFDPDDWGEDPRDLIPGAIRERLDNTEWAEDPAAAVTDAYESWRDDVDVLDISGKVSFVSDGVELRTLTMVLGTGGPHVEVTLDANGRGHVRAYSWFMDGLTDVPVDLSGHPIASLFEIYAYRFDR